MKNYSICLLFIFSLALGNLFVNINLLLFFFLCCLYRLVACKSTFNPKFIYRSEPLKGVIFRLGMLLGMREHYRGNSSEIHN